MQSDGKDEWTPQSIHDRDLLEECGGDFMYFGCIRYIVALKKGVPFFEHSPMLNDISNLASWSKVSSGLLRLFEGEVLNKRQVVQHFVFQTLFAADWIPSQLAPIQAPTENFREPTIPLTRAPWAAGGATPPPTRAPWANDNARQEGGSSTIPPTKAPWAK